VWVLLLLIPRYGLAADPPPGTATPTPRRDVNFIQSLVDDLRGRLALPQQVRVTIVPTNPLKVSVQSVDELGDEFLLSFEESFLAELTDEELKAAIAHELGHVWIFTHHPYLQTEALANQIAARVVTRDSLVQVYEKVWKQHGTKNDLARFVSD
jgi:Zn-dependent protease with chaperone function